METFTPILEANFGKNWNINIKLNFLEKPKRNKSSNLEIIYKREINHVDEY